MEHVAPKLLEYGLLGVLVLVLGFVIWHLYKSKNDDVQIWKDMATKSHEQYIHLSIKQNETNSKLIDIREKDVEAGKEQRAKIIKDLEDMPAKVAERIKLDSLK